MFASLQNANVWDVREALEALVSKESLQGYTCPKAKVEVTRTSMLFYLNLCFVSFV